MEKFVLVLALFGSVLYLFDKMIAVFTSSAAKQKEVAKERADAEAQAKADATAKAMSDMQQQAANLMKALSAFQGVNGPAAAAPSTPQAKPAPQQAMSQNLNVEQKMQVLADIVSAQSSQLEAVTNQLAQIAQHLEATEKQKRRAPRKAAAADQATTANPSAGLVPSLGGLDAGAPLPERGTFEIVS